MDIYGIFLISNERGGAAGTARSFLICIADRTENGIEQRQREIYVPILLLDALGLQIMRLLLREHDFDCREVFAKTEKLR